MASCGQAEVLPDVEVFVPLRRLRDISRLVLVAIEREDTEEIERLAHESQDLIERMRPLMESPAWKTRLPQGTSLQIEALARSWRAIVEGLEFRATEVRERLWELRRTKTRTRRFGLHKGPGDTVIDRDA